MNWFKQMYFAPLRALAVLFDIYEANRNRVTRFLERPAVRTVYRGAVIVTALAWLVIWLIADPEDRGRLTEEMKALWPDSTTSEEIRKSE